MLFQIVKNKIRTRLYCYKYHIECGKHTSFLGKADIMCRGSISFGSNCSISPWVVLKDWGGYIRVGNNCSVNSFCHISGNGGVEIGNNVRIATQCVIISANHIYSDPEIPICEQGEKRAKIVIEEDCWLGAGVKVLAGVTIGKGSVIGAGAVVNKDIPPYSVAVGVPAVVVKKRKALDVL